LFFRSRGSAGKGKDSEYENLESENGEDSEAEAVLGRPQLVARDSEQREIDEFEEEERRLLAEEAKVGQRPSW
jgi:hypothetical protein